MPQCRIALDCLQNLKPAAFRQVDVQQDEIGLRCIQVRALALYESERLIPIRRDVQVNRKPSAVQRFPRTLHVVRIILNQEDLGRLCALMDQGSLRIGYPQPTTSPDWIEIVRHLVPIYNQMSRLQINNPVKQRWS